MPLLWLHEFFPSVAPFTPGNMGKEAYCPVNRTRQESCKGRGGGREDVIGQARRLRPAEASWVPWGRRGPASPPRPTAAPASTPSGRSTSTRVLSPLALPSPAPSLQQRGGCRDGAGGAGGECAAAGGPLSHAPRGHGGGEFEESQPPRVCPRPADATHDHQIPMVPPSSAFDQIPSVSWLLHSVLLGLGPQLFGCCMDDT